MFAIAGSHRSGKTTLARDLAALLGVEFLETKVSDTFAALGIDPKAPLTFDVRLDVQNKILHDMEVAYALRAGKIFIADRSPFDVLGYTLADVQRDTLDDALRVRFASHMHRAIAIVKAHLAGVMLVLPLPDQPETPGKAQSCPVYMHHVYTCVRSMIISSDEILAPHGFMSAELTSFNHQYRMDDAVQFMSQFAPPEPEVKLWTPNS